MVGYSVFFPTLSNQQFKIDLLGFTMSPLLACRFFSSINKPPSPLRYPSWVLGLFWWSIYRRIHSYLCSYIGKIILWFSLSPHAWSAHFDDPSSSSSTGWHLSSNIPGRPFHRFAVLIWDASFGLTELHILRMGIVCSLYNWMSKPKYPRHD